MPKPKKEAVADSWEDEDLSDSPPNDPPTPTAVPSTSTPAAAQSDSSCTHDWPEHGSTWSSPASPSPASHDPSSAKRPEKTDAVARRMIAAGLGLKAPKQTEEQRAYQKAIREQERRKKEQQKAEEQRQRELEAKAKAAVWDD